MEHLRKWLKLVDIEEINHPGKTEKDAHHIVKIPKTMENPENNLETL